MVHAESRPFAAETNSVEYFMYEGNYGPVRMVVDGRDTTVVTQNDDASTKSLTDLFTRIRPNIVTFEEPVISRIPNKVKND